MIQTGRAMGLGFRVLGSRVGVRVLGFGTCYEMRQREVQMHGRATVEWESSLKMTRAILFNSGF